MIGGIVMSQSNLEKQEAKLKSLNQKIKDEKNKIEQRLGKQIISTSNLDYANLSNQKIKDLAQKIATVLNHESNNQL
jgi:septal ring factor EnvC (AmiA/AmiB activator)